VATIPCNLSLRACFADINVSQGSVATYARCGGILNIHLTTNLARNFPGIFFNHLRFDSIMVMSNKSVAPLFRPILHVDLQIGKKHRTAWSVNALRRPAFTGGKIQIHIHVIRYADRYTNNWQPDKHKHVNTCILHHLSIKKQQHL